MNDKKSTPYVGFKGSDLPPLVTDKPPHVLIAGAGLAGLFLGILLEEAGIPYHIFERFGEIRPLGKDRGTGNRSIAYELSFLVVPFF